MESRKLLWLQINPIAKLKKYRQNASGEVAVMSKREGMRTVSKRETLTAAPLMCQIGTNLTKPHFM